MMNQTQHLATSDYDRLLLHALSGEEEGRIQQHLADCVRCRTDHAGYAADAQRFSQEIFPRTVERFNRATPGTFWGRVRQRRLVWLLAPAMTVALALVVVGARLSQDRLSNDGLSNDGNSGTGTTTDDDIRIKGGEPTLRSFARRTQHVFPVQDGMELHPGDELRFVVDSPSLRYLLVASIDGTGKVNVYFPYDGSQSGAIATGKPTELPGSIVLDHAPGPERIFAFYSKAPLFRADLEPALKALWSRGPAAIRAKDRLSVKAERQSTFLFEKAAP